MEGTTLLGLVRRVGAKRRAVQLWAEAGAIQADPISEGVGTGTHRRFSRREIKIAKCLAKFAAMQIAIGELVRIGEVLRPVIEDIDGIVCLAWMNDGSIALCRPDEMAGTRLCVWVEVSGEYQ